MSHILTDTPAIPLTAVEQSQFERIELAKGAWREGRSEDALILIDSVKSEKMTDRVAGECFLNESVFYAEAGENARSEESLNHAARFMDSMTTNALGTFHNQRARIRKERNSFDAALMDYAGAAAMYEQIGNKEKQGAAALNVAGCYLALGDLSEAQVNLDKAFLLLTGSFYLPKAHETQAEIYLAEGKLEAAARAIKTALSMECPDNWRTDFIATQDLIEAKILEALQVKHFSDWDQVKLRMARRALQRSAGNPAGAASILGVTRFAIQSLIDHHPEELEPYRMQKRVRRKTLIKQK